MNAVVESELSNLSESAEKSFDYLQKLSNTLAEKAQILIGAFLIFLIGLWIIKIVRKVIRNSLEKAHVEVSVASFINSLVKFALWILLGIIVVTKLGVDATSIIALLTSASLAIGLAIQGSLANFAGGVLILLLKPFKVGDFINDGNGHEGTVVSIEIIYTRLLTPDNQSICVPNGKLADSSITNLSKEPTRRIDFEVGIDYGENIDRVRTVLLSIADQCETVITEMPAQVFVSQFDSSSVNVVLRTWCKNEDYWPTRFELQENIKKAFDAENINIPYNHLDVNILNK